MNERGSWWEDAKFGLMIHWGVYSKLAGEWRGKPVPGLGEWIRWHGQISREDYAAVAAAFDPKGFDANAWAGAARGAGMRCMVAGAKHHDGFALFDSKADSFNSVRHAKWGRDAIAELSAACRDHGLKFGVYYSHAFDWNEPDAAHHWTDRPEDKPRFDEYFRRKALPQIEELMSGYGKIDVFWPDMPFIITPEQCEEVLGVVRRLQPDCLVCSRIGWTTPSDFRSLGDNEIPASPGIGRWETAATLNDTWGFKKQDTHWKSSTEVLRLLLGVAAKGGNLLLNVGPDGEGRFPTASSTVLAEVGEWLEEHGEAIYGSERSPFPYDLPHGPAIRKGRRVTVFLDGWSGPVSLAGLPEPVAASTKDAGPFRIHTMDFEKTPAADPVPQPQGRGEILLPCALAQLSGGLSLTGAGAATGGPGVLAWSLRSPGGRYGARLLSSTPDHLDNGGKWAGGDEVRIGGGAAAALKADEPGGTLSSRYYESAWSILGEVELPTGMHTLSLEVLGSTRLHLAAVQLVPAAGGPA